MSSRKLASTASTVDGKQDLEHKPVVKVIERPTIILKSREGESRAASPSQKNENKKESETQHIVAKPLDLARHLKHISSKLTSCIKFADENMQLCDNILDYLLDQHDFLVIACVGTQGVGKSTIMSLLTSNNVPEIFPIQKSSHHETGAHCTQGIDFYINKHRVIYLDTQPILSVSALENCSMFDQKKNGSDFVGSEPNLDLQSLQFLAFIFSVCHVVIFVQDWFVDPNLIRILQAAEMLKPSSSTAMDQDYVEYYPHVLLLHNKAQIEDYMPKNIEIFKDFYNKVFASSRLQMHSGINMSDNSNEGEINLFLIPFFERDSKTGVPSFKEDEGQLIKKLRQKIYGVAKNTMTPATLTEKNWYHYVSKIIDAIKKSHLSTEYSRLMP